MSAWVCTGTGHWTPTGGILGLEVSEAVGRLWAAQRGNPRAGCGPRSFSSGAEEGSPRHFCSSSALLFPHYSSHDKPSPVQKTLFPLPSELIATCTGNCGRRTLRSGAHFCPGQVLPCLGLLLFASWQGPLKLAGFQQFLLFGCHGLGRERLCPMSRARIPLHQGEAQGHGCHFPKAKWGLTKLIKSSF